MWRKIRVRRRTSLLSERRFLAEPLIKPERDKPSLYRRARADMDKKFSKRRRRR